jgi:hypothetical protein
MNILHRSLAYMELPSYGRVDPFRVATRAANHFKLMVHGEGDQYRVVLVRRSPPTRAGHFAAIRQPLLFDELPQLEWQLVYRVMPHGIPVDGEKNISSLRASPVNILRYLRIKIAVLVAPILLQWIGIAQDNGQQVGMGQPQLGHSCLPLRKLVDFGAAGNAVHGVVDPIGRPVGHSAHRIIGQMRVNLSRAGLLVP